MYIKREIESTIDAMLTQGKVVLVTGARQVGKTTVLNEQLGSSFNYVSMENPRDYLLAKRDAVLFFDSHDLPLIIDEVQRVPELFSPVKCKGPRFLNIKRSESGGPAASVLDRAASA